MSANQSKNSPAAPIVQQRLECGVELLAEPMPGYHTATLILRVRGGMSSEPADQLGLAYVVEQALDKGTRRRSDRELADAFDAIGAHQSVHTGRQTWALVASGLPEHLPRAIELLGDMAVDCVFPDSAVSTAVSLSRQELVGLEDSPRGLLRRRMALQAYGDGLGRHQLGRPEALDRIDADAARQLWQGVMRPDGLVVAVAGAFDFDATRDALEAAFGAIPAGKSAAADPKTSFDARTSHIAKSLDQTQIGISFPGVPYVHPEYAVERVIMAVLSGGMSARLFTELREKRGLVYWVGAWHEQPRGQGMVHLGAATTPQRCRQTYDALLAEIERLGDDLSEEELERAKTGIIAEETTSGAGPDSHAGELLVDHFHLGRVVPTEQKLEAVRAVTVADIQRYLASHSRDALSVVTVGKDPLVVDG